MTKNSSFRKLALEPRLIRVKVHFEPSLPLVAEKVDIIEHIRGVAVRKVHLMADLSIEQVGRFLKLLKSYEGSEESDVSEVLGGLLIKATGKTLDAIDMGRLSGEILRFLEATEILDDEFYFTSDGEKLYRYYDGSRAKFLDYLANLILTKAGWVAIITQVDRLQREPPVPTRMSIFVQMVADGLLQNRQIKKADYGRIAATINCLVSLKLVGMWETTGNGFLINKDRLLEILVRKSFT